MNKAVAVIGVGEMGGVFARGFLKLGLPVIPIPKGTDLQKLSNELDPSLVLVAVGEKDLHSVLAQLPAPWHSKVGLLQNELLPRDWLAYSIKQPTVVSVWFEKKPGQDYKVLVPSPVYGPHAHLLMDAMRTLDIPSFLVADDTELLFQLVRKNVYILVTNISGLVVGGTVEHLWRDHQDLARAVADEIIEIQEWLTQHTFDRQALIDAVVEAIDGDPQHKCMGRSAPARLNNALSIADEAGIAAPTLRGIATKQ